jgi:hypothetical protein
VMNFVFTPAARCAWLVEMPTSERPMPTERPSFTSFCLTTDPHAILPGHPFKRAYGHAGAKFQAMKRKRPSGEAGLVMVKRSELLAVWRQNCPSQTPLEVPEPANVITGLIQDERQHNDRQPGQRRGFLRLFPGSYQFGPPVR